MNWCVSKLPVMDEGDKGGAAIAGAPLGMFDKGDEAKKMAAWEFIMYTVSPEVQAKWSMDTGYLPVNIHSEELPDYKAYIEKTPPRGPRSRWWKPVSWRLSSTTAATSDGLAEGRKKYEIVNFNQYLSAAAGRADCHGGGIHGPVRPGRLPGYGFKLL